MVGATVWAPIVRNGARHRGIIMLQGTIVSLDGERFGFEYRATLYNEPKATRHVWELERVRTEGYSYCRAEESIGRPATCRDGAVSCYLGNGNYVRGLLVGGASAKASVFEITDVPCPKARGKETRWHNGRWEKLLRTGWAAA